MLSDCLWSPRPVRSFLCSAQARQAWGNYALAAVPLKAYDSMLRCSALPLLACPPGSRHLRLCKHLVFPSLFCCFSSTAPLPMLIVAVSLAPPPDTRAQRPAVPNPSHRNRHAAHTCPPTPNHRTTYTATSRYYQIHVPSVSCPHRFARSTYGRVRVASLVGLAAFPPLSQGGFFYDGTSR